MNDAIRWKKIMVWWKKEMTLKKKKFRRGVEKLNIKKKKKKRACDSRKVQLGRGGGVCKESGVRCGVLTKGDNKNKGVVGKGENKC